jgi:hypothetical protein
MKTHLFYKLAVSVSILLLSSCGPAGDKDLEHTNFPKIANDGYYKDHDEEPSTNPAYTRQDDTTKIEQKEKGTVEERQQ